MGFFNGDASREKPSEEDRKEQEQDDAEKAAEEQEKGSEDPSPDE